jgi:hypothetical protein
MQASCLCRFVAYGEGRDCRKAIAPDDCRRLAPVYCLPLQVAECSTWNNAIPVSLSSVYGEGVVLGARPYYCKPEEFLRKVIFCSSASGQSALWRKLRHEAEAKQTNRTP